MSQRQLQAQRILGAADHALGQRRFAEALAQYKAVFQMGFESWAIHVNAAQCCKRMGDIEGAFRHFERGFRIKRRPDLWARGAAEARVAGDEARLSLTYRRNLSDQLAWLRAQGEIDWFDAALEDDLRKGVLTGKTRALRDGCSHYPEISSPCEILSPDAVIERVELSGKPGDCFFILDNVLTGEGRQALLDQLLKAAIWFDVRDERGYLGAHLHEGFATPFVLGLAREMQATISRLAEPVEVAQLWAFRYLQESQGIDIHADQGDWNLNIWPVDETHLQEGDGVGGMTLYDLRIGEDIAFEDYNARPELNRGRIAASGAAEHVVPYRGNRAVLFPSKYLHKTNAARFSDSHEGRRINVTMMADRAVAAA